MERQMKRLALPKFSSLSRRERTMAAVSLLVVTCAVLERLVLGPWWRHTQHIHQEIRTLEQSLTTHRKLLSRRDQVIAQVGAYGEYLRLEGAGVLDMATLLREIEALGQESGISLGEVRPLPAPAGAHDQEHAVEIHYEGTLQQWVRFIHLLETSTLLFEIDQTIVEVQERDSAVLEGTLRLTHLTIRHPEAPEPPVTP